jgi:hypothetical protein
MQLEVSGTKAEMIQRIRKSIRRISIWNSPVLVMKYFIYYLISITSKMIASLNRVAIIITIGIVTIAIIIYNQEGLHQPVMGCTDLVYYVIPISTVLVWMVDGIRNCFFDRFRNRTSYFCSFFRTTGC